MWPGKNGANKPPHSFLYIRDRNATTYAPYKLRNETGSRTYTFTEYHKTAND